MRDARSRIPVTALLALATGCASAPSFDIATLKPTEEADQATLTGHFELSGLQFRLYPGAAGANAPCLSGALTSLAGLPPPEYTNRQMTLTGHLHRAGSAEAGAIVDACGSGIIMLANEVIVPQRQGAS
jgi:hypothetical protein